MGRIGSTIDHVHADALGAVPHGFLGRGGGVSTGLYAGLNTGTGSHDDPGHVAENRRRAVEAVLPGAQLVTLHQCHSARAIAVDAPFAEDERPEADGMATATPGLLLGILTADCVPLLLADADAGVVGAAHAGWKGALAGIAASTVEAMETLGARRDNIRAAVGPCIALRSYEVDEALRARFVEEGAHNERFFASGRTGHYQFDIEAYAAHRLHEAGIGHVEILGQDTYADEARFFSYRRATHRGESDYGRQISLIGLADG